MSKTLSAAFTATVISLLALSPALALVNQPSPLQAECLKTNPSDHMAYLDCIKSKKLEARKTAAERRTESAKPADANAGTPNPKNTPPANPSPAPAKTKISPAGASDVVYPQTESR
jgi:hypothetical protein